MIIQALQDIVGTPYVLEPTTNDLSAYLTDWRKRYQGKTLAVVRPASTAEIAQVVQLCVQHRIAIVPQGGNTSLCGASIPDASGTQLLLNLTRLNRIRAIDVDNETITVEAGCILQSIQEAATASGKFFPVSLAAEASCTIGGNLSTNAGGTAVLRYGNTREQCLGLEVVTAAGDIWHGLRGLRKDNTGYDLRDLFIGAEGTLGIITAAVLKLSPRPLSTLTALIGVNDIHAAVALLRLARNQLGGLLTGFELISDACLSLVASQFPNLSYPFTNRQPQFILLELSDFENEQHAYSRLEAFLDLAQSQHLILDALLAQSLAQTERFWAFREHIPLAQARLGKNIKHDISLPVTHIETFFQQAEQQLHSHYPGCRIYAFGHLGDGNIHYNVAPPMGVDEHTFLNNEPQINTLIYELVEQYHGSISAEHGIGQLKRLRLQTHKGSVELNLMRSIKQALDPLNLMNPGKVI